MGYIGRRFGRHFHQQPHSRTFTKSMFLDSRNAQGSQAWGMIFTEVPDQDGDAARGVLRGQFHLLFFKEETLVNMMLKNGFERIVSATTKTIFGPAVRAVFRKPINSSV